MALKTIKRNSGFTIVELLIVIVVIAILATISIVAYNGIQTRANNSAAASAAENVAKKLEAYNSINGNYPAVGSSITAQMNVTTNGTEANLTGSGITLATTAPGGSASRNTVKIELCDASAPAAGAVTKGYKVYRYDYSTSAWQTTPDQSGGVTTACAAAATTGTTASWNP